MFKRQLHTEIDIDASAETVWEILTDFGAYPDWNPFILSVMGDVQPGNNFKVTVQPDGGKAMLFNPICLKFNPPLFFSWRGKLLVTGLFDGTHRFEIRQREEGGIRFLHSEHFTGLLAALLWGQIDKSTRAGFEKMNRALKERAEGD